MPASQIPIPGPDRIADALRAGGRNSALAHLDALDPAAMARIRMRARRSGVWKRLDGLDPDAPIPVLRRSTYRDYRRYGSRERWQEQQGDRLRRTADASLALWLGHPAGDIDHLQDLVWAACEDWTWVMPAHEPVAVDLGSAAWGELLADVLHAHRARLEPEVVELAMRRLDERLWQPAMDRRVPLWWRDADTNWSLVCWSACAYAALALIDDHARVARIVHAALRGMSHGIGGFTADGGCREGIGYWEYGFGAYLRVAHALGQRSGGRIRIADDERIRRIAAFPHACYVRAPVRVVFGDGRQGHLGSDAALLVRTLVGDGSLLAYCRPDKTGRIQCRSMHELTLADDDPLPPPPRIGTIVLPQLGQALLRGDPGAGQLSVFAHAGDNGVPHNHNDLGSIAVYRGDSEIIADPGGPRYTAATFGPQRYDNMYCSAEGHSVPVIDGVAQEAGSAFCARILPVAPAGDGIASLDIDLSNAYPARAGVRRYIRSIRLDARRNALVIAEALDLARRPRRLQFRFISQLPVRCMQHGGVRIGSAAGMTLRASISGSFAVETFRREARENGKPAPLRRISFTPATLETTVRVSFRLDP